MKGKEGNNGTKVNPTARVGIINDWDSRWYVKAILLIILEDYRSESILKIIQCWYTQNRIERASNRLKIIIHAAKPGVIGRGSAEVEAEG